VASQLVAFQVVLSSIELVNLSVNVVLLHKYEGKIVLYLSFMS
jgi:hypothetical protein